MKRKIRIIIAAIVAMSGVVTLLAPASQANAEEAWCTYGTEAAYYKYCANRVMVRYGSSSKVCKGVTTYSSDCVNLIKGHTDYRGSDVSDSGKVAFASAVLGYVSSGKYDPCASLRDTAQYDICTSQDSNYDFYHNPAGASGGGGGGSGDDEKKKGGEDKADTGSCTSILPPSWCNKDNPDSLQENGIVSMIKFVVSVMTGAVVVAGSIGIVVCGIMWMTARENETQVATAKRRLLEIVIGIIAWALISVLINFFIPQSEADTDALVGAENTIIAEKEA